MIIQDQRIKGVVLEDGTSVKISTFADDTIRMPTSQNGFDIIWNEIVVIWGEGSGMCLNKDKCELQLHNIVIHCEEIKIIPSNTAATTLGIPVGRDIDEATALFWERIITKMVSIRKQWAKAYLSLKGRVLIANTPTNL